MPAEFTRTVAHIMLLTYFVAITYAFLEFLYSLSCICVMDELDRKIISLINSNGRASNAHVARQVDVSEGTVRRRLKKLIRNDVIHIVGIPNPEKLGFPTEAIIGLKVDPDHLESVANKLSEMPDTQYVACTTGAYDIFTWVAVSSPDSLRRFLVEQVAPIPGIRSTETFVNLATKKRFYEG
jgi:Lrp/AsnC family transcriptional regulator for asnA, asnC and gidA